MTQAFNMDWIDGIRNFSKGFFDLLVTDPPYNTTENDWDKEINLPDLWEGLNRVVKPNGAMIFTTAEPFTSELIMSNKKMFRYDVIWSKPLCTGFLNAKRMPLRNHENIIVFYQSLPTFNPQMGHGVNKKGKKTHKAKTTNYGDFNTDYVFDDKGKRYPGSVIEITNGNRSGGIHPTQKPIDLFRYLIKTYSNPGDKILDCYLGSGSSRIASDIEGRDFWGYELDAEYFDAQEKRFSQHIAQQTLAL